MVLVFEITWCVLVVAGAVAAIIDLLRLLIAARTPLESPAREVFAAMKRCEFCRGTGLDDPRVPGDWCPHCHGTGAVVAYLDGAEDTAVEHADPDPEDRAHDRYIDEQNGVL